MNILLIIDTEKYRYHSEVFGDFETAIVNHFGERGDNSLETIDMAAQLSDHEKFEYIKSRKPDFIITLDFSGFELVTTGDTLSYNNLHSRMANVLLQKTEIYSNQLKYRQNFSMYTYIQDREDINLFRERYPWIPNANNIGEVIYYRNLSVKEHEENIISIENWLMNIMKEMRYNKLFWDE